jgi:hypothetical protein
MKTSNTIAFGLLLGVAFTMNAQAAGSIMVRESNISLECAIPATVGDHIVSQYGCTNDQAYSTRLINVDSALSITYFDGRDNPNNSCKNDGWEIEVLTIKQPTTTPALEYITIESMAGVADGEIIQPGLRKIRYKPGGTIHGHLSCIRIERK